MPKSRSWKLFLPVSLLFSLSCGGPTSPSSREPAGSKPTPSTDAASHPAPTPSLSQEAFEEFNCTNVKDVHVRFSDPGYIEENRVGLYALYEGVPAGEKLLRIWWDLRDPTTFENLRLGEGEVRRDNDQLFDLEALAEHVYQPVSAPEERSVRAELILLGKTGNCARNRTITITPVEATPTGGGSAPPSPLGGCSGLRFCDLGDGSVRDNTTGLVWLRNAGCIGFRRWRGAVNLIAALASGQCGLSDGSSPGDWRLPTLPELDSLLDPRFSNPSLSNARGDGPWIEGNAFAGVKNAAYWTSDIDPDCLGGLPGAMVVDLGDGGVHCRILVLGLARSWPVRTR